MFPNVLQRNRHQCQAGRDISSRLPPAPIRVLSPYRASHPHDQYRIRKVNVTACKVVDESLAKDNRNNFEQLDVFTDYEAIELERKKQDAALARERKRQDTIIELRKQFGKNAILKGMNFEEGATTKERNAQIGGHRAGNDGGKK